MSLTLPRGTQSFGAQLYAIKCRSLVDSVFDPRNLAIKTVEAHMTMRNNMAPNMGPYSVVRSFVVTTD